MPDLVTVFGVYEGADGAPAKGAVVFVPDAASLNDDPGRTVTQQEVAARLFGGWFEVDLVASDDAGWVGGPVAYRVSERIPGLMRERRVMVNGPGPVDINTLPEAVARV